jgi:hypothetical protein
MSPAGPGHRAPRLLTALVLAVMLVVLLQGATVPHTHDGVGPGLYNQDHDLALLATLHGHAALADAQPAPTVLVVATAVTALPRPRPDSASRRAADSRAPPTV